MAGPVVEEVDRGHVLPQLALRVRALEESLRPRDLRVESDVLLGLVDGYGDILGRALETNDGKRAPGSRSDAPAT